MSLAGCVAGTNTSRTPTESQHDKYDQREPGCSRSHEYPSFDAGVQYWCSSASTLSLLPGRGLAIYELVRCDSSVSAALEMLPIEKSDDASNTPKPVPVPPTRSHLVERQPPSRHRRPGGGDHGTKRHPNDACCVWSIPGIGREHDAERNEDHPHESDEYRRHSTPIPSTRLRCHAVSRSRPAVLIIFWPRAAVRWLITV